MLDLERVKGDDRLLRALTGLNLKALTALQPSFAQALAEAPLPRRSPQPFVCGSQALRQVYRNRIEGFDDCSMVTAAGLWNFYLEAA